LRCALRNSFNNIAFTAAAGFIEWLGLYGLPFNDCFGADVARARNETYP